MFANRIVSETTQLSCRVPQGSVLEPILFVSYLYADDIQLFGSFKDFEFNKLCSLINCVTGIKQWLSANFLQMNLDKTAALIIAPENKTPLIKQHLCVLGRSVQSSLWNLGVIFYSAMSLEHHTKLLIRNYFFQLRNIS